MFYVSVAGYFVTSAINLVCNKNRGWFRIFTVLITETMTAFNYRWLGR